MHSHITIDLHSKKYSRLSEYENNNLRLIVKFHVRSGGTYFYVNDKKFVLVNRELSNSR